MRHESNVKSDSASCGSNVSFRQACATIRPCASPIFVGSKTDWKQKGIKEYFWSGLVLIVVFNLGRQRLQLLMPQCRRISVLPLQSARDKQRPDQMPD